MNKYVDEQVFSFTQLQSNILRVVKSFIQGKIMKSISTVGVISGLLLSTSLLADTQLPQDSATGFAPGSLRGAFTLTYSAE